MIIVTAAILENGSKVMIAKRKEGKHLAGFWEFPGGKIEDGETAENCLRRELKEEFSIEVEVMDYIGESIFEYPGQRIKLLAYTGKIIQGEIKLHDHEKVEWVKPEEISEYKMAPADIPLIGLYDKKRNSR